MSNSESERLMRLLKQAESPLQNLVEQLRLMEKSAAVRSSALATALQLGPSNEVMQLRDQIAELNRSSAFLDAAFSSRFRSEILEQFEANSIAAKAVGIALSAAILPAKSAIAELASQMASHVGLFENAAISHSAWSRMLEQQMFAVSQPWINASSIELSLQGFAVVSRLGLALRREDTFDDAAIEIIDADLGDPIQVDDNAGPDERDAAHFKAGMNPSILAIPSSAMGDVLVQTGFVFRAEFIGLPQTIDGSDPGHKFHPSNYLLMTAVEQNLRRTINDRMTAKFGENWIATRVNSKIAEEWNGRRDAAVSGGEAPLSLIQYSNFMELKDIVVGRLHWSEVFEPVFKKKEHFQVAMERLHPIRLPLAHSRPIGTGQQFHLISEASYILRSLGIDIFCNKEA